jgi:hypothetical protein
MPHGHSIFSHTKLESRVAELLISAYDMVREVPFHHFTEQLLNTRNLGTPLHHHDLSFPLLQVLLSCNQTTHIIAFTTHNKTITPP